VCMADCLAGWLSWLREPECCRCRTQCFRMLKIFPADSPRVAVLEGPGGLMLRLEDNGADWSPSTTKLRLSCDYAEPPPALARYHGAVAPNGCTIEVAMQGRNDFDYALPRASPEFVLSRGGEWGVGRSGMQYRDLIPGRQGGRYIGSHIRIPGGGPLNDYVHFHQLRFQFVYCYKGWVKLAYEGQGVDHATGQRVPVADESAQRAAQLGRPPPTHGSDLRALNAGPPFIMRPGDCVLQPPGIRHRVLESGEGMEVIEVASPAEHETFREHVRFA
jgi:hypothetical protein